MWSSYSARQAAQLIGLPESAVRGCIRDGLVGRDGELPARLTFRDLAALRAIKSLLDHGVPLTRARRELGALAQRLPEGASITHLPVEARRGHVHVRGATDPGQLELPFAPPSGELRAIPAREPPPAPEPAPPITAEAWLARARAAEDAEPEVAIDAYRRCLRLRPDSTEAWINLGRLHAEAGDGPAARTCFATAIELDPADATALYDLGVVEQDAGAEAAAIALYERALAIDPELAEAHYNLATLFDQRGDTRLAIRHINEYRKLTR